MLSWVCYFVKQRRVGMNKCVWMATRVPLTVSVPVRALNRKDRSGTVTAAVILMRKISTLLLLLVLLKLIMVWLLVKKRHFFFTSTHAVQNWNAVILLLWSQYCLEAEIGMLAVSNSPDEFSSSRDPSLLLLILHSKVNAKIMYKINSFIYI